MSVELMGAEKMKSLLGIALEHSTAEQTEAGIGNGSWALTRFANSSIHQNMASQNIGMRVRAVFGKKVASGSTNVLTEAGIRKLVDDVVNMARLQDPNKDFVSLPEPGAPAPSVETFAASTADSTPEQRATAVKQIVDEADKIDGTAAGSASVQAYERAVMNSLGIDTYYRGTGADITTVVTGPDGGFGYAAAVSGDVSEIDAGAVGLEASADAYESRNPDDIQPGDYECILMPYAAGDMLRFFRGMGFYAMAYQEGRSFLCAKLGEKVVSDKLSIWDDGFDPRTIITPYDSEGVTKQRVDLLKDGVATGLLYDSYTAHREGKRSTGHAGGMNMIVAPGDATVADMVLSTKRGLLVTRFHYVNVAHQMTASITGMTRDGTFLIENGRIKCPVKNLRFTQSMLDALNGLEFVGCDPKLVDGVVTPAIKMSKFRFSSATEF